MSILQERQRLRRLTAGRRRRRRRAASRASRNDGGISSSAGQAMPLGATLALVWLATSASSSSTISSRSISSPLFYMLPVVVAATQWGLGPGIVGGRRGRSGGGFLLLSAALYLLDPRSAKRRRSCALSVDRRWSRATSRHGSRTKRWLCSGARRKSPSSIPSRKGSRPA